MIARNLKDSDLEILDKIYREYYQDDFYLPSLKNTITHAVIEYNNTILGFGEVKIFAEAIMILDKSKSNRIKHETMRALMYKAIQDSKSVGVEQLHVSVKDKNFADSLIKHYDFEVCNNIILARKL